VLLLACAPALAVIETYDFDNESLRARFKDLAAELRCPKCQNQNIADSNAPIAADLRKQLHAQLHAGKSDEEIVEFMVDRYGEFVLYRPRVNKVTLVLWLAPAILLVLALLVLRASFRGRAASQPAELSPEEQAKLDALLASKDGEARQ
jgi:cytochrome c-type biogenesis protein CcmH